MTIRIDDIVPLSIARARFSELADDARDGGEKIITKNGAAYVALIDARRLDHYHRLERERAECACAALLHGGGGDGRDSDDRGNGGDAAGDAARGGGRDSPGRPWRRDRRRAGDGCGECNGCNGCAGDDGRDGCTVR